MNIATVAVEMKTDSTYELMDDCNGDDGYLQIKDADESSCMFWLYFDDNETINKLINALESLKLLRIKNIKLLEEE